MTIYTDCRNLPGPGDEATWGPCLNHPNDPRTPDWSGDIADKQYEVFVDRAMNIDGYFRESFSEADKETLEKLSEAIISLNPDKDYIADLVYQMVADYCTPSDEEAMEMINNDREIYGDY